LVPDGVLTGDGTMTAENTGTLQQFRLDTKHEFNRGYWQGISTSPI
jgi:hypothetical protein